MENNDKTKNKNSINIDQLDDNMSDKTKNKKNKKKKNKIVRGIIEWTVYAIIFFLIVWGTPKALSRALNTNYPIASITSSSMWPVLKKGDIVFIKGASEWGDINIDDIAVFENEPNKIGAKSFTIHRVILKYDKTFITKGDANNTEDPPVKYEQLIGRAVKFRGKVIRIPHLGKLSQIFQ